MNILIRLACITILIDMQAIAEGMQNVDAVLGWSGQEWLFIIRGLNRSWRPPARVVGTVDAAISSNAGFDKVIVCLPGVCCCVIQARARRAAQPALGACRTVCPVYFIRGRSIGK